MRHDVKLRIRGFPEYFISEAHNSDDIKTIGKLAHTIWHEYYPAIISREQISYMLNKMYTPDVIEKEKERGVYFYLVYHRMRPVGFISISEKHKKEYFLHKFYLLSRHRKKGLGMAVFKKILELLKPDVIRLTVNRQNYKSINFYFKAGFIIEKVADFDIGRGFFMNDFIMCWKKRKP